MLLKHGVFTPKEFLEELSVEYNLSLESFKVESLLGLLEGTLKVVNIAPMHELRIKKND